MELKLYKTSDAANVINKTLTGVETLNITFKRDTDIVNPVLYLTPEQGLNYFNFNYCEIVELNRKYFINNVEMVANQFYRFDCECDFLETYKTEILASSGKLRAVISGGDFGAVEPEFTGDVTVYEYFSDVELVEKDNSILSVLRWS